MPSRHLNPTEARDRQLVSGNQAGSKTNTKVYLAQNAKSAGVGNASLSYLAQKAVGFAYEAADIATQVASGGRGILDFIDSKLSSPDKKNN